MFLKKYVNFIVKKSFIISDNKFKAPRGNIIHQENEILWDDDYIRKESVIIGFEKEGFGLKIEWK